MFIVFEGLDGGGKSTQIELLKQKFPDAVVLKYPTMNIPILNAYLHKQIEIDREKLFYLFFMDILFEQPLVKEILQKGGLILMDRYVFSTIAYERSMTYEEAKRIMLQAGFIAPDVVILIDIPPEVSQERKQKQKRLDRYEEDVAYLEKVRNGFLELCKERFMCEKWYVINGENSIEAIHKEILNLLKK